MGKRLLGIIGSIILLSQLLCFPISATNENKEIVNINIDNVTAPYFNEKSSEDPNVSIYSGFYVELINEIFEGSKYEITYNQPNSNSNVNFLTDIIERKGDVISNHLFIS